MTTFAISLQVWDITRSTAAVGLVALATVVPLLAVGLSGGALIDAVDTKRLVFATTCVLMAVSAALTVQAWLGSRQVGLLYTLVAIDSAVTAVNAPARRSLTPALLPAGQLAAAQALQRITFQFMMIAGPALAGLVAGTPHLGLRGCYLIDTVSFWRRAVRGRQPARGAGRGKVTIRSVGTEAGFRHPGRPHLHRADAGAAWRVRGRCQRDVLRAADVAVPGAQRGAVRRRPEDAWPVHRRDRRRRHGHRGAVRTAGPPGQAGRGDAGVGHRLGRGVRRLRDRALALADAAGARRGGRGRHDHGGDPRHYRDDRDPAGTAGPGDGGRLRGGRGRRQPRLARGGRGRLADQPGDQRPVRRPAGDRVGRGAGAGAAGLPPLPAGASGRARVRRLVRARSSG